jgi:hypothetical protein
MMAESNTDVTDQYIVRARQMAEEQYASLILALSKRLYNLMNGWLIRRASSQSTLSE